MTDPASLSDIPLTEIRTRTGGRRPGEGISPAESRLLAELEGAAQRGELSLAYQPQVNGAGGLVGVETLLRWTHPEKGAVDPAAFIPLAERAGVIRPVTRWVLGRVLEETHAFDGLAVGFNASAPEFSDPAFADEVAELVMDRGFDPGRLEIEVTETAILGHESEVHGTFNALHSLGVHIALDDFGAGYSSLNSLLTFPFDKLKIDQAFTRECVSNPRARAVIGGLIAIGRDLGMTVVAEGVETEGQREFLVKAGVDAMQGYLFGAPMPVADLRP